MSPSAAQGGAMAIEDAYVLATALSNTSRAQAALAKYAQARQGRTVQVARLSARNLNLYEAWNVPAFARNSALRVLGILPATLLLSRLDWLFGWKPDWLSRNANRA
jgi:salicylate hydroxylase